MMSGGYKTNEASNRKKRGLLASLVRRPDIKESSADDQHNYADEKVVNHFPCPPITLNQPIVQGR